MPDWSRGMCRVVIIIVVVVAVVVIVPRLLVLVFVLALVLFLALLSSLPWSCLSSLACPHLIIFVVVVVVVLPVLSPSLNTVEAWLSQRHWRVTLVPYFVLPTARQLLAVQAEQWFKERSQITLGEVGTT